MEKKKILVAYYSLQGHTEELAKIIQDVTEADIFKIELEKPYNLATSATVGLLHIKNGHTPALKNHVENIEQYDTIFLGAPIWWYTVVPPLKSFIKEHDLTNKLVIPFCTHGGNTGDFFEKFPTLIPDSKTMNGYDLFYSKSKDPNETRLEVEKWVSKTINN